MNILDPLSSIAAVVVPCSARKTAEPAADLTALTLATAPQEQIARRWLEKANQAPRERRAKVLYSGHGFRRSLKVAQQSNAALYIISAGLGLVHAETKIPAYDLSATAVGGKVSPEADEKFSYAAWWSALQTSRYSTPLRIVARKHRKGLILLALTRPYAQLVGDDLAGLSSSDLRRVRILGLNLSTVLPVRLHPHALPYDRRLDAILPGAAFDFCHRALGHFATHCLPLRAAGSCVESDRLLVTESLADARVTPAPQRQRLSDEEIKAHMTRLMKDVPGITASSVLSALRGSKIACEQGRCARFFAELRNTA